MQQYTDKRFHAILGILGCPIQPSLRSNSEANPEKEQRIGIPKVPAVLPRATSGTEAKPTAWSNQMVISCLSLSQPAHTLAV